jgi:Ser/Thr protein kinase RdoA (MazF antagonist)
LPRTKPLNNGKLLLAVQDLSTEQKARLLTYMIGRGIENRLLSEGIKIIKEEQTSGTNKE